MILYSGINCLLNNRADFTFRNWVNTLYPDVTMSSGGKVGTPDEVFHVLVQGGILILIRGSGGATDYLINGVERNVFNKNTGAKIIIADNTPNSLEEAINQGLEEAGIRWLKEGRTQNRFSHVVGELEKIMEITQYASPSP